MRFDDKDAPDATAAGAGADAQDEFEMAFAEAAGDDQPPAKGREDDGGDEGAAANAGSADAADPNEGQGAAPAAGADGAAAADTGAGGTPTAAQAEDIWATATPEQRAEIERLRQAEASARGRISFLQRSMNIADMAKTAQTPEEKDRAVAKATDLMNSDAFKRAATDYPEVVEPLRVVLEALAEKAEKVEVIEQRVVERDRAEHFIANQRELEGVHPDWRDFGAGGKHNATFVDWYKSQPPSVQRAIEANGTDIVDPVEAAYWLGRFKQDAGFAAASPGQQGQSTTDARRRAQLQGSQTGRNRSGGSTPGVPDDFDAAFEVAASEHARQRR